MCNSTLAFEKGSLPSLGGYITDCTVRHLGVERPFSGFYLVFFIIWQNNGRLRLFNVFDCLLYFGGWRLFSLCAIPPYPFSKARVELHTLKNMQQGGGAHL